MPKVFVEGQIKSSNETVEINEIGLRTKRQVTFQNKKDQTKYHFDFNTSTLMRENDKIKMIYCFENQDESVLFIKELNRKIVLPIEIKRIEKGKNTFLVEYMLEEESFLFTLNVKEVE